MIRCDIDDDDDDDDDVDGDDDDDDDDACLILYEILTVSHYQIWKSSKGR